MTSDTHDDTTSVKPGRTPIEPSRRDAVEDWLTLFVRMLGLPASETEAVRDELEDHLRSRVDDLLITGVSEPEAVRRAVAELGETATLAQGFRNARRTPRRRTAMYALFAIAGSALVLSSTALYNGSAPNAVPLRVTDLVQAEPADHFGDSLHRYDVSRLVPADQPLQDSDEASHLLDVIRSLVARDAWEENGGDQAHASVIGNTLFVDGPEEIQNGVAWVLGVLTADADRLEQQQAESNAEMIARVERSNAEAQAFREEKQRKDELERQGRIQELRKRSEMLLERLVDLRSRDAVLSPKLDNLSGQLAQTPDDEVLIKALMEATAENTRVSVELEDVEVRLEAVRAALINLEMADYAVSPGSAPTPTVWRTAPERGTAASFPTSPSGRLGR